MVGFGTSVSVGQIEVDRVVERALLEVREHLRLGAPASPDESVRAARVKPHRVDVGNGVGGRQIIVDCQAQLLHVVGALGASGCFSRRLHGRQQQRDQNRDDGDHDQQLDQRETAAARPRRGSQESSRHVHSSPSA